MVRLDFDRHFIAVRPGCRSERAVFGGQCMNPGYIRVSGLTGGIQIDSAHGVTNSLPAKPEVSRRHRCSMTSSTPEITGHERSGEDTGGRWRRLLRYRQAELRRPSELGVTGDVSA